MTRSFDRRALDALLRPRSVAIVGASDKANVGGRMLRNMQALGFPGPIWPVNPNYEQVGGLPCYPDVASLPETPDCVAFAVPGSAVAASLAEAAARRVPSAVVVADGFADAGTRSGRLAQERLIAIATEASMAMSGPNSQGLVGLSARFATAFTNLPKGLVHGGVSLVSQSGGLLNAVVELGHNRTVGFNYLLSAGNEAVVSAADYIDWLADDPQTSVILNIVEGVRDGRHYRDSLARAAARKPVVVLKLGRTDAGSKAAAAHTGSLAGSQRVFAAAIRETGAILVHTIDQLIESAKLLSTAPLPRGKRVFIFSVSGGASVLSGDLARDAGLILPPVPVPVSRALGEILGVNRHFHNPMDVVGAPRLVRGDNLTRCLDVLMACDRFDAIALVMVVQRDVSESHHVLHQQFRAHAAKAAKPLVLISEMTWHPAERPAADGPPIAGRLDEGLVALSHLVNHAEYRRKGPFKPRPLIGDRAGSATVALPRGASPGCPLTEPESYRLLERAGLPIARWEEAADPAQAAKAARSIGFPVVLKAIMPGLAHKSDAGGVRIGLANAAAVIRAGKEMAERIGSGLSGFLVQEMVAGGTEMILGARFDPQFGPVVMVGAGGTLAELADDTALALAPVSRSQAQRMIARLKADRLLAGYRGAPPLDRVALADCLAKLSRLAARAGERISELDVNPVIVLPRGQGVRIVDALAVTGHAKA